MIYSFSSEQRRSAIRVPDAAVRAARSAGVGDHQLERGGGDVHDEDAAALHGGEGPRRRGQRVVGLRAAAAAPYGCVCCY